MRAFLPVFACLLICGCASERFQPQPMRAPEPSPPVLSAPSAPVTMGSPLPPPPGAVASQPSMVWQQGPQPVEPPPPAAAAPSSLPLPVENGRASETSGVWTARTDTAQCSITLSSAAAGGGFLQAQPAANCPAPLNAIRSYAIVGTELLIRNAGGQALAQLTSRGPSRFEGRMDRVALTLSR